MKTAIVFVLASLLSSCSIYEYSDKREYEELNISAEVFAEPLRSEALFVQQKVEGARGFVTVPLLLKGADLAYQGIVSVIAAKKEANLATYTAGLANQRFYANVSKHGRMDPDYLSFKGFKVTRNARIGDNNGLTFSVQASLDTTKLEDIVAGSKFYLNLDKLEMSYAKLKYLDKKISSPGTWFTKKEKNLNLDVNVDILATWIDDEGIIHENVKMGTFFYPIRHFDLEQLKNGPLTIENKTFTGSSYIIPRSTTFCLDNRKHRAKCYGLGDFNIEVTVIESKENSFVEKAFYENKSALVEALKGQNVESLIGK